MTEIGGQSVSGRAELAESVTSRPVSQRLPRYHEALPAAFASGAPVREAAGVGDLLQPLLETHRVNEKAPKSPGSNTSFDSCVYWCFAPGMIP